MKAKEYDPTERRNEFFLGLAIITIFSSISSVFVGAILAGMFGDWIEQWTGFPVRWWHGLLVGLAVGLVGGVYHTVKEFRRIKQLEENSKAMGLQRLADDELSQVVRRISRLVSDRADLIDAHFRSMGGVHLVVGDLRIENDDPSDDSKNSSDELQTCVYFQFERFQFPRFEVRPEGFLSRMFEGAVGVKDLDFDDSPLFSKKYQLTGEPEDSVRKIFDKQARDFFESNLGLRVIADENRLIFFKPKWLCPPDELDKLVHSAMECNDLLQQSAESVDINSDAKVRSPREQLEEMSGFLGAMLRKQVESTSLNQQGLQAFLKQPLPREIPKQLRKRFRIEPILLIVSLLFAIGGLIAAIVISMSEMEQGVKWLAVAFASFFVLIGSVIYFVSRYFRERKYRVLRHGKIVYGTVESVEQTGSVIANHRVHAITFNPSGEGRPVKIHVYGCNLQRAFDLEKSGEITPVLVDPNNPGNRVFTECYAI